MRKWNWKRTGEEKFLRREIINSSTTRPSSLVHRIHPLSLHSWPWKLMQCYIYILNVRWRKKINNQGHSFQTNRKEKWNIIKLYKQREKSIKFSAAHLLSFHSTQKPAHLECAMVCVMNLSVFRNIIDLSLEALKNTSWFH